jgi:hypothetical protein
MIDIIYNQIATLMATARDNYNVDPIIFLIIYFCCVPIFYFSLYKTIRSIATKVIQETVLWSTVFMASCVAPFIYVMLFGKNIPWWVYILIAIIIGQSIYSFVTRLRQKPINSIKQEERQ